MANCNQNSIEKKITLFSEKVDKLPQKVVKLKQQLEIHKNEFSPSFVEYAKAFLNEMIFVHNISVEQWLYRLMCSGFRKDVELFLQINNLN